MSALPLKADIACRQLDVRFVPKTVSCTAAIKAKETVVFETTLPATRPRQKLAVSVSCLIRPGVTPWRRSVQPRIHLVRMSYPLRAPYPRLRGPSIPHSRPLKHFFGRSGVALRDAELLERFRPPCTRDCKGFHVEIQDFTQLLRDFIRGDHRTKLDDALP